MIDDQQSRVPAWRRYLRFWRRDIDADIDDEIRLHLEERVEDLMAGGMPRDVAHRQALEEFGDPAAVRSRLRSIDHQRAAREHRTAWWQSLGQDLHYALRSMRSRRVTVAVIITTLALGIGATTTVFSVVDGVLLQPLPYTHPEQLVAIENHWQDRDAGNNSISPAEYFDYLDQQRTLSAFGVYAGAVVNLTGDGEPERVTAAGVSAGVMSALGIRPQMGRLIDLDDDRPGANDVVLLSHELWERRFASSPEIVGKRIQVDGTSLAVIGVLPPHFRLPADMSTELAPELFTPLALDRAQITIRGSHFLTALGRLRTGATTSQANADFARIAANFTTQFPKDYPTQMRFGSRAVSLRDAVVGDVSSTLLLLLGAVGLVLLIACANAASLLLAQAEARRQEIAVRTALGASRGRLLRQLIVESLVLAGLAAMLGTLLAIGGVHAIVVLHPMNMPRLSEVSIDGTVLAFVLGVAVLAGLLFGTAPALHALRTDVESTLRGGSRALSGGVARRQMRRALVAAEIAIAVVLLVGAALLGKSFSRLMHVDPGFRVDGVVAVPITLPVARYRSDAEVTAFYRELDARVRAMPGVRAVGSVAGVPLVAGRGDIGIQIEGRPIAHGAARPRADWQVVTPGYMRAIGMHLLRGRELLPTDVSETPGVVLINESMAKRYWPNDDAIGKRFKLGGGALPDTVTVVGVVRDVRQRGLSATPEPEMYLAHAQFRFWGSHAILRSLSLVVNTEGDPAALMSPLRREIRALAPDLPVGAMRTMEELRGASVAEPRFMLLLLLASSGVAFVIAVVGLYGMVAYSVSQRRKEFGVRVALGAQPRDIIRLVLWEGALIAGVGIAVGLPSAVGFGRALTAFLYDVSSADPLLLFAVPLSLAVVTALASYVPARRATRVDTVSVLRSE